MITAEAYVRGGMIDARDITAAPGHICDFLLVLQKKPKSQNVANLCEGRISYKNYILHVLSLQASFSNYPILACI